MSHEMHLYGNYFEFDHAPTKEEILTAKLTLADQVRDTILKLPCFIIKDTVGLAGVCDPIFKYLFVDDEPRWTVGLKAGLFIDPSVVRDESALPLLTIK